MSNTLLPGSLLHHGHSSAVVMDDGSLFEVRRGNRRFLRIQYPRTWSSAQQWLREADSGMGYNPMDHPPAPSHWNDAQRYVSQWLSKSTLEYIPASYETKYAAQANLMHARDLYNSSLHAEMTQEDRLHMLHALQACEAVMQELERGYFRIPKHTSELLVRDSVSGHIIPVYMNLEMGVLGIRHFSMEKMCMEDVVGYSFEDLGISVVEMYRYEMGGYYRIL